MAIEIDVEIGPVRAIAISALLNGTQLVGGRVALRGWSIRETSGAAIASAEFSSGAQVVAEAGAPTGGTDSHVTPANGVLCPSGLTMTFSAGQWFGALWVSDLYLRE